MSSMATEGKTPRREIVRNLQDIPSFASEDEEREWWATHDLAEELGVDVTDEHHALIRQLKRKYRYGPMQGLQPEATTVKETRD